MNSEHQLYAIIIFAGLLGFFSWTTSDDKTMLVDMNRRMIKTIELKDAQIDSLMKWVEECEGWENSIDVDTINLKMTSKDSVKNLNLSYRNLNRYLLKYPPTFKSFQSRKSSWFLKQ